MTLGGLAPKVSVAGRENQNWERSDQPKDSLQRVGVERRVLREVRFWLVAIAPSSDFVQPLLRVKLLS